MIKASFIAAVSALALVVPAAPAIADEEPEGLAFGSCAPTLSVSLADDTTIRARVGAKGLFGTEVERPAPDISPESSDEPTTETTPDATTDPTDEPTDEPTPGPSPDTTTDPTDEPTTEPTPEPTPAPTPDATPTPSPDVSEDPEQLTASRLAERSISFCPRFRVTITATDQDTGEVLYRDTEYRRYWVLSTKWTLDIPVGTGKNVLVSVTHSGTTVSESISTPGPPGEPQNFVVTDAEPTSLTVSWTPPADTGGKAIEGYTVQWDNGSAFVSGTSYAIRGLEPETTYAITVRARNQIGESIPALVVKTTPGQSKAPSPARNLTAVPLSPTSMALDWDPPADDGGSPILGYVVSWPGGGTYVVDSAAVIESLTPATRYTFDVRARNDVGASPTVSVTKTTPLNPVPRPDRPSPPRNLVVTDVGHTTLTIAWDTPTSDGGSPVDRYLVEWDEGRAAITDEREVTLTGLTPGTEYTVNVQAMNQMGASRAAEIRAFTAMDPVPAPTVPTSPEIVDATGTLDSLIVTFEAPTSDGGSPILFYELYDEAGNLTIVEPSFEENVGVLTGYGPGEIHTVSVRAVNQIGAGPAASAEAKTNFDPIPAPEVPSVPLDLDVVHVDYDSIAMVWQAPTDDGRTPIVGYQVAWGGEATLFVQGTSAVIDGLQPGREYPISVRAVNQIGAGPAATRAVFTALDPIPAPERPSVPRDVKETGATGTSIAVDWETPAADGGTPITGYRVQVVGGSSQVVTDTAALLTGLQPNRVYSIAVSALNQIGESDSVTITARTAATPPGPSPAPAPQPFTPDVPGGNADGSIDLDGRVRTVAQTAPGDWPADPVTRNSAIKPIEKEPLFLTNADQMAQLDITYTSPSIKRATVTIDPKTDTYVLKAVLKKGKVSGSVILTVEAPSIQRGNTIYEELQSSERFIIRRAK